MYSGKIAVPPGGGGIRRFIHTTNCQLKDVYQKYISSEKPYYDKLSTATKFCFLSGASATSLLNL
jgi:hypothetical protein